MGSDRSGRDGGTGKTEEKDSYTDVFGKVMCDEAGRNDKLGASHFAAMQMERVLRDFERNIRTAFDVGIAGRTCG